MGSRVGSVRFESVTWRGKRTTLPVGNIAYGESLFPVYSVGSLFPDQAGMRVRPISQVEEIAMHHDAVAFSGKDANFNGSTLDESLDRLSAVYNWHINLNGMREPGAASWQGIGYHAMIDPAGRIFIPRTDVLDTSRAHVAGYDPARGNQYLNNLAVGICFMGNFADSEYDHSGLPAAPAADRPTVAAMAAFNAFAQFTADSVNKALELHPHSWYARYPGQGAKPCPGNWVKTNAWSGSSDFRYQPSQPTTPPPSTPTPPPPPSTGLSVADLSDLAMIRAASEAVLRKTVTAVNAMVDVEDQLRQLNDAEARIRARHA